MTLTHFEEKTSSEEVSSEEVSSGKKGFRWKRQGIRIGDIIRILVLAVMVIYFFANPELYRKVTETGIYYAKKRMLMVLVLAALAGGLPLIRDKIRWPERVKTVSTVLILELGPILAVMLAEYVHGRSALGMTVTVAVFNYLLVLAIFCLFYALTHRIRMSMWAASVVLVVFSLVNYFVIQFRNEPILAGDVMALGTAMNVAESYQIVWTANPYLALFSLPVLSGIYAFLPECGRPKKRGKKVIASLGSLSVFLVVFYIFAVSAIPYNAGYKVKMFDSDKSYQKYGQAFVFIRSIAYTLVEKPEGYAASEVDQIAASNPSDQAVKAGEVSEANPNLIVIMDEALADFEDLGSLEASEDCLEYIHSLKGQDNVIYGNMYVSVFGGHTANTEYELLTGNSTAFLPPSCVPYTMFTKSVQPAMGWNMMDLGYSGLTGFHSHKASGYNRNTTYPHFGFQNLIFREDMDPTLTKADKIRGLVSDQCDFETIVEDYEASRKSSHAPYFMFNVTMQNHGGYDEDDATLPRNIKLLGDQAEEEDAERYINLLDYTDEAFRYLTDYFSKVDEPTVIVMFGDHEPGLGSTFLEKVYGMSSGNMQGLDIFLKYQTPLIIWANYDINEDGQHDEEFAQISANYLGAQLMELTGQPKTGYQKYQLKMREEIPVLTANGYIGADRNFYELKDKTSPYYDLVVQYQKLVYNNQFDKKGIRKEFFYLDGHEEN
ncbi:MAG: LTA synthase family protein [Clostridiales bacterium]|nr:LTA synthase family protein [Clostridiales bacterium]